MSVNIVLHAEQSSGRFPMGMGGQDPETARQGQAGAKKDVALMDVRTRGRKMESVGAFALNDRLQKGLPGRGHRFGEAGVGAGGTEITTLLVTETRTSTLQDHCKR